MSIIDNTPPNVSSRAGEPDVQITHPAWCDRTQCDEDRTGGYLRDVTHWTAAQTMTVTIDERDEKCEVILARSDNYDGRLPDGRGASNGYIRTSLEGDIDVDELEQLGQWLISHARAFRAAIATEAAGSE